MEKDKLEYFIVFTWQTATESGIANQVISVSKKISSLQRIRDIENYILNENPNLTVAVITNFILLN